MQKLTNRSKLIDLVLKMKNINFQQIYKEFHGLKTSNIKGANKKFNKKNKVSNNQSKLTNIISKDNKRDIKNHNKQNKIHRAIEFKINKQK